MAATLVGFLLAPADQALAAAPDAITTVDSNGFTVGSDTSVVLDAGGRPVISYMANFGHVRLAHCGDAACSAGNAITGAATSSIDKGTSLALDSAGNPVIAYSGGLVHCGDPNCSSGNVFGTAPIGESVSLTLDAAGNPVVSYTLPEPVLELRVLHCDDPKCTGGGDSTGTVGSAAELFGTSIALDGAGNPVVSYKTYSGVAIAHCNDATCSGGDESISILDVADAGRHSSLELDAAGNPVVAYTFNNVLRVLHCNDPDCMGGDESFASPTGAGYPDHTSLELDAGGNPVVSYSDLSTVVLKLLRCDDPNCDGTGEVHTAVDSPGNVGPYTSLVLDASEHPVISYFDHGNDDLKLIHCASPSCDGDGDDDGCSNSAEQQTAPGSELSGGRRDLKNRYDYFNPTGDGQNRIDDVLAVVDAYFMDDTDGNPGLPPYAAGYNPDMDRTLLGPDAWDTWEPNGLQRVDDVLNALKQYFHDCG